MYKFFNFKMEKKRLWMWIAQVTHPFFRHWLCPYYFQWTHPPNCLNYIPNWMVVNQLFPFPPHPRGRWGHLCGCQLWFAGGCLDFRWADPPHIWTVDRYANLSIAAFEAFAKSLPPNRSWYTLHLDACELKYITQITKWFTIYNMVKYQFGTCGVWSD